MSTNERKKAVRGGSNDVVSIWRKFSYDFGVEGGAIGAITLAGKDNEAEVIPAGSVILNTVKNIRTTLASGGSATLALGVTGTAGAFLAAIAFDNAANVGTDAAAAALPLVTTADVSVIATVAAAALTAGAFDLWVEYIPPIGALVTN